MQRRVSRSRMTGASFVDPRALARIDNLELVARGVVDGFINGIHRSPYLGFSLDFAEHRAYMPGDDIRRIDWKVYARTDRYYLKQYEADTNANFSVLLDVSRSMGYGSRGITKLDYGRFLAATLAYFSHKQGDRVGLLTFDQDVVEHVPPSARHLDVVLHAVDRTRVGRPGALGPPLRKMAEHFRRRGVLALVSDLYEEPAEAVRAVRSLRSRGNEIIVFHLLDPAELEFPFEEASSFQDLETGERIPVVPARLRERYRTLVREHVAALERELTGQRIDYALFDTSVPLDHALFRYLSVRQRLARVR